MPASITVPIFRSLNGSASRGYPLTRLSEALPPDMTEHWRRVGISHDNRRNPTLKEASP
jgi:hypothetical protein